MAIYHCTMKTVSRSSGRSAVAAAAYRAAGLEVEQVYVTSGRMRSLENWMARADTPPDNQRRIHSLIENAPESLKEHIDIGRDGEGNLFFSTSQIRILGRKR